MVRTFVLPVIVTAVAACGAASSRSYVVRLDLEQIAADTAARDASPGFTTLDT
jgi:hypothetical protein